jgi:hypothetical protein
MPPYAADTPVAARDLLRARVDRQGTQLEQTDTGPGGTYSRLAELGTPASASPRPIAVRPPSGEEADR